MTFKYLSLPCVGCHNLDNRPSIYFIGWMICVDQLQ